MCYDADLGDVFGGLRESVDYPKASIHPGKKPRDCDYILSVWTNLRVENRRRS